MTVGRRAVVSSEVAYVDVERSTIWLAPQLAEGPADDRRAALVHELAHQIDRLSGDIDGAPPLPPGLAHADWVSTLTAAWDRLNADLEAHREPFLDPYAAESPAEFFAVACEAFFDVPIGLRTEEPELYRVLALLFDQDPALH